MAEVTLSVCCLFRACVGGQDDGRPCGYWACININKRWKRLHTTNAREPTTGYYQTTGTHGVANLTSHTRRWFVVSKHPGVLSTGLAHTGNHIRTPVLLDWAKLNGVRGSILALLFLERYHDAGVRVARGQTVMGDWITLPRGSGLGNAKEHGPRHGVAAKLTGAAQFTLIIELTPRVGARPCRRADCQEVGHGSVYLEQRQSWIVKTEIYRGPRGESCSHRHKRRLWLGDGVE
ncbi:hypothetical protein BD779DRAFT_1469054 [Infundibulicybe gibba]|nr:hypothetical protein BD779DRAFT_1469054 [Infundibulicybe gibba]